VVAVVGVDAQLVDDLEAVLAPVLDVHQGVVQRCAVVPSEGIDAAQGLGSGKDIRGDDFIQEPGELSFGQLDSVEGFKLLAEVFFQASAIADVCAIFVLQVLKLANEAVFDVLLFDDRAWCSGRQFVAGLG
jgi:hypothetical protein